jgi:hypothetical protein
MASWLIPKLVHQREAWFRSAAIRGKERDPVPHFGRALRLQGLAHKIRKDTAHGGAALLRKLSDHLYKIVVDVESGAYAFSSYYQASDVR